MLGVEEEFLNVLKEKMPTFLAELVPGEKAAGDGLGTIAEGDEEDYGHEANEDLSQASEGNSQSQTSATRSRSASQAAMYEEGIEGDEDKDEEGDEDERDWDEGGLSQGGGERVLEVEEGDEDFAIPTAPVFDPCPEDDDFLAALDKVRIDQDEVVPNCVQMVNDNITESKGVARDKASLSTMTAPVASGK